MKKHFTKWMSGILVMLAMLLTATAATADRYLPFILAYKGPGDFEAKIAEVKQSLEGAGFAIAGDYVPYENAHIVIFTSDALRRVAAQSDMGGFGAAMRASINQVGNEIQVAFVNPEYLAVAYRMKSDLVNTRQALEKALGMVQEFGSRELTKRKLARYNYTFGMEYFDDTYVLAEFSSHREALAAVERNLASNRAGVRPLYRIDIPGKEETIFGVSMKMPEGGSEHMDDTFQMSVVDFEELKQNAYLPYEVMVMGNKVVALHMRFRMAVHFPGLKMMGANSFMRLMSSPEAIRKTLTEAVGGNPS
jgi:hypothetical protein